MSHCVSTILNNKIDIISPESRQERKEGGGGRKEGMKEGERRGREGKKKEGGREIDILTLPLKGPEF